MRLLGVTGMMLAMANASPAAAQPPKTVAAVDLDRYAGRWYEVARFPNRFQRHCAGDVVARYTRRPDGRIDVVNTCRTADGERDDAKGVARVVSEDGSNSKLKVRFAPAFLSWVPAVWGDYWILDLAPDYSHAIVGDPERKYLWFLARTPTVSAERLDTLKQRAAALGFDVSRLEPTVNRPEGGSAP
jgi:apolipoprotein D and lipocalin family protein